MRLVVPLEESDQREVLAPYPAFRWLWKTMAVWPWKSQQPSEVLEVASFLAELRRKVRDPKGLKRRYLHIVSSLVTYFAVTKGRSDSSRVNHLLRRGMAIQVSSRTSPLMIWTLSKWNLSEGNFTRNASSHLEAEKGHAQGYAENLETGETIGASVPILQDVMVGVREFRRPYKEWWPQLALAQLDVPNPTSKGLKKFHSRGTTLRIETSSRFVRWKRL